LDPGRRERLAHGLLVIDDQPKMSPVIAWLLTTLLQGDELVTKIDECGPFALSSQLEVEQAAVKRQRLFDIADLQGNVIDANGAGFLGLGHSTLHLLFAWIWCDQGRITTERSLPDAQLGA